MGLFCGFSSEQNFPGDAQYPQLGKGGGATLTIDKKLKNFGLLKLFEQ